MNGYKIDKLLINNKPKKMFLFVYDQGTHELFAETTKYYNKYKELFNQYKDMLTDNMLLNIYKGVYQYTRKKYEEFSKLFDVKPSKEFETLDFVADELLNRNAIPTLLDNLDLFDEDMVDRIVYKVVRSNNSTLILLAMLNWNSVPSSLKIQLEYSLFSTKDYEAISQYVSKNEVFDVRNLMETALECDSNYLEWIYSLGCHYHNHCGFDNDKFVQWFIKNNAIDDLECFYLHDLKVSREKFLDDFIKNANAWELCTYAIEKQNNLSCQDIKKIEKKLMQCDEPKALFKFLSNVAQANLSAIQNSFIEQGYCKYMFLVAKKFEIADRKRLKKEINKREDLLYMFKFDNEINNIVRYDVIEKILASNDDKLICAFSTICPKEYLKECEEKLKSFKDDKYLRFFYETHRR